MWILLILLFMSGATAQGVSKLSSDTGIMLTLIFIVILPGSMSAAGVYYLILRFAVENGDTAGTFAFIATCLGVIMLYSSVVRLGEMVEESTISIPGPIAGIAGLILFPAAAFGGFLWASFGIATLAMSNPIGEMLPKSCASFRQCYPLLTFVWLSSNAIALAYAYGHYRNKPSSP